MTDPIRSSDVILFFSEASSVGCEHERVHIRQVPFINDKARNNMSAVGLFCLDCSVLLRWLKPGEERYDWDREKLTIDDPREV